MDGERMSKMTKDMAAPIASQGLGTCEKERRDDYNTLGLFTHQQLLHFFALTLSPPRHVELISEWIQ